MIEVKNLSVSFNSKAVLNNLSIEIKKGSFTAIIGPNGCGKSTLVKAVAGLISTDSGVIIVDGKLRNKYKRKEFARKVAFLMQFGTSCDGVTARDLVEYGRNPYRRLFKRQTKEDEEIIEWAIEKTHLREFENRMLNKLSGGERQRAFLAMAIAQQTEVLILDEPTNHLDIKYQYETLNLVKKLNQESNITVICILHDINQALRYSDNIIVMKEGRIVTNGATETCVTKELMQDVYEIKCDVIKRRGVCCIDVF
ncbi:ABC transporter ATP-binding protein [Alkaliphilus pronyensis]|uniref:ABC transporter ATP-binding protein n=1 Tax=Alkaliphilus pronyensis TaxID=1482732 RepID=A0A6I0F6R1_9FIRM|nr:ABC transporter ATP-binding protein [Alkaliphilus pronyensis]KAB3533460.1 ABC transporter ATP-binding protein [Alkaliphilus pronyensis]